MFFRSVFVDRDVDQAVVMHAKAVGATPASVYRRFLETGLAELGRGVPLPAAQEGQGLALRTVYVSVEADEKLTSMAFHMRIEKADLSCRAARLGMLVTNATFDSPSEVRTHASTFRSKPRA